jgi:hypothetical protein
MVSQLLRLGFSGDGTGASRRAMTFQALSPEGKMFGNTRMLRDAPRCCGSQSRAPVVGQRYIFSLNALIPEQNLLKVE